ncbi:unnamed protein product [Lathyrus sativus]|nr:unnamed protein product [Lathyrus sativus]
MQGSSNASESAMVIETLRSKGWYLEDTDDLKAIIVIQTALADDSSKVLQSVESELLNSDLRSIGAKSLPEPTVLRNPSFYLQGPKVLQISSARDISMSSVDIISRNSSGRRVLRLCLTDGHSEITAVEYSHIPFIPDNVVPGTKIRLENKVPVHSGIACLNPKALTVLGGVVQSLYEEWQMNQKYSGFSRSSLRQLEDHDTGGPPPFVKLQVGSISDNNSRSSKPIAGIGRDEMRPTAIQQHRNLKEDIVDENLKSKLPPERAEGKPSNSELRPKERAEDKPSSSSTRPKEVVESVPVQNQAAAQKLLQKLNQPNQRDRHPRGRRHRGKGQEEDEVVFTLEEYEKRKTQVKPSYNDEALDISRDEYLARQLQNQFNLEHSQVQRGPRESEAENIRMNMFTYEKDSDDSYQMGRGGRGGRGRGRHG